MTSKFKCPICQQELVLDFARENYLCDNPNCVMDGVSMMRKRWESLIQTKEELDDYKHNLSVKTEQHERGYAYATKTIKDLKNKLEIATKALKDIKRVCDGCRWCDSNLYDPTPSDGRRIAETTHNALEQIKHKE